jgi:hypothetical protein
MQNPIIKSKKYSQERVLDKRLPVRAPSRDSVRNVEARRPLYNTFTAHNFSETDQFISNMMWQQTISSP